MTPERAQELMIQSLHEYTAIIKREARRDALEEAHDAAADALGEDGDICCYKTHGRMLAAIRALIEEPRNA